MGLIWDVARTRGAFEDIWDMEYVFDQWKKEEDVDFTEVEWLNEPDERTKEVQLAYTVVSSFYLLSFLAPLLHCWLKCLHFGGQASTRSLASVLNTYFV